MSGLKALRTEVERDLKRLSYPAKAWLHPRRVDGENVLDVLIVGGGQCGLATAFGLILERVDNILVVDAKEPGREGPWRDYARMPTLRTDKTLTGLDWGIASLTPQAWYEARYGAESWASIDRIPREDWQRYLTWFSETVGIPILNRARVTLIEGDGRGYLHATVETERGIRHIRARKVVLATGMEGNGSPRVPANVQDLPRALWAHATEAIDFRALAGRRVCVLGSGASAFDNAVSALDAGARAVAVVARRQRLPSINPANWIQFSGFLAHYAEMPIPRRHAFLSGLFRHRQPATQRQYDRCMSHPAFALRLGIDAETIRFVGGGVVVADRGEPFDFLVSATGFEVDLSKRPELRAFADEIALWGDRYTPPLADGDTDPLAKFPFLGPGFEFVEKRAGAAPDLRHIHNFAFGAAASMGITGGSITGIKYGSRRLVHALTGALFLDDIDRHYDDLLRFDEDELKVLADA